MHQKFPTVMLWDDHEVEDNYAGGERDGGLAPAKRYSATRKAAAYRAFFESMPYTPPKVDRIYRALRFGRTVDLVIMDQRQYRKNQPCGDAVAPAVRRLRPARATSSAARRWRSSRSALRSSKAQLEDHGQRGHDDADQGARRLLLPDSTAGRATPASARSCSTYIRDQQIKDVVFVTGDIHTFIAGDVRTNLGDGDTVAVEFVGGSITSQGLGETDLDAGNGTVIKGNDKHPNTPPGADRRAQGRSTRGSTTPTSTTTATAASWRRSPRSTASSCA